jgi:hypothetical protein
MHNQKYLTIPCKSIFLAVMLLAITGNFAKSQTPQPPHPPQPPKSEKPEAQPDLKPPKFKFSDVQIMELKKEANKAKVMLSMDKDKQPILAEKNTICPKNHKAIPLKLEFAGIKVTQPYCVIPLIVSPRPQS